MRAAALAVGWLCAAAGLYGSFVLLELYWNLYDWQPKWDRVAAAILGGTVFFLISAALLGRAGHRPLGRAFGLLPAMALVILGIYVLPTEPITAGFFGREAPSPGWYRVGRCAALSLPLALWIGGWLRQCRQAGSATPDRRPGPA